MMYFWSSPNTNASCKHLSLSDRLQSEGIFNPIDRSGLNLLMNNHVHTHERFCDRFSASASPMWGLVMWDSGKLDKWQQQWTDKTVSLENLRDQAYWAFQWSSGLKRQVYRIDEFDLIFVLFFRISTHHTHYSHCTGAFYLMAYVNMSAGIE